MGARGKTAEEMSRGLRLSGTKEEISKQIHQLIKSSETNTMPILANKIFVKKNYRVNPEFIAIAKVLNTPLREFIESIFSFRRNFIRKWKQSTLIKVPNQLTGSTNGSKIKQRIKSKT